jgi:hypothetical protein
MAIRDLRTTQLEENCEGTQRAEVSPYTALANPDCMVGKGYTDDYVKKELGYKSQPIKLRPVDVDSSSGKK